jgi:hypothetical protein
LVLSEFQKVNKLLIGDCLGLKEGDSMLIPVSAGVPEAYDIALSAQRYAEGIGVKADVFVISPFKRGDPPNERLTAAAREVDGLYQMAPFHALDLKVTFDKLKIPMIYVGETPGTDESLIRTMVRVDPHWQRKVGRRIADEFTDADTATITTRTGTDYTEDITGIPGEALSGFAADPEGTPWEYVPGSCPGIVEREWGPANGKVVYDDGPFEGAVIVIEENRIVGFEGGFEGERLKRSLEEKIEDEDFMCPCEWGIGTNPNARMVAPNGRRLLEWERVMGLIHFHFGDSQPYPVMKDGELVNPEWKPAKYHAGPNIWYPTVYLDDKLIVKDGVIQETYLHP